MKKYILIGVAILILNIIILAVAIGFIFKLRDQKELSIFQSGIELGYEDAMTDIQNSKVKIFDDFVILPIQKNGNKDSVRIIRIKNPNFLIKEVADE